MMSITPEKCIIVALNPIIKRGLVTLRKKLHMIQGISNVTVFSRHYNLKDPFMDWNIRLLLKNK